MNTHPPRVRILTLCVPGFQADQRIQNFLNSYLEDTDTDVPTPKLPVRQFKMDRHGLAKMLSLPKGEDKYINNYISSYRVSQVSVHICLMCVLEGGSCAVTMLRLDVAQDGPINHCIFLSAHAPLQPLPSTFT